MEKLSRGGVFVVGGWRLGLGLGFECVYFNSDTNSFIGSGSSFSSYSLYRCGARDNTIIQLRSFQFAPAVVAHNHIQKKKIFLFTTYLFKFFPKIIPYNRKTDTILPNPPEA